MSALALGIIAVIVGTTSFVIALIGDHGWLPLRFAVFVFTWACLAVNVHFYRQASE